MRGTTRHAGKLDQSVSSPPVSECGGIGGKVRRSASNFNKRRVLHITSTEARRQIRARKGGGGVTKAPLQKLACCSGKDKQTPAEPPVTRTPPAARRKTCPCVCGVWIGRSCEADQKSKGDNREGKTARRCLVSL